MNFFQIWHLLAEPQSHTYFETHLCASVFGPEPQTPPPSPPHFLANTLHPSINSSWGRKTFQDCHRNIENWSRSHLTFLFLQDINFQNVCSDVNCWLKQFRDILLYSIHSHMYDVLRLIWACIDVQQDAYFWWQKIKIWWNLMKENEKTSDR